MALGTDLSFTLSQTGDAYAGGVRGGGGVARSMTPAGAVKAGVLQHVVYTSSNDSGAANIYVDNVQLHSRGSSFFIIANADYPLAVGGRPQAIHPWHGEIYLVAIYDRALSLDEIGENFLAGPNPLPPIIPEPPSVLIGLLGFLASISLKRRNVLT
jgi:hypothetical protein